MTATAQQARENLKNSELVKVIDDDILDWLLENSSSVIFRPGKVILNEGEASDAFYLIVSGTVKIYRRTFMGEVVLSRLTRGQHFGEYGLLNNTPRAASVKAETKVTVLEVSRQVFMQLAVQKAPSLKKYFEVYLCSLSLREILDNLKTSRETSESLLKTLLDKFEKTEVKEGEQVIRYGDIPDGFYLVHSGRLEVTGRDGTHFKFLTSGNFFGEVALLLNSPRAANVTALQDSILYRLSRNDFQILMEENPELHNRFTEYLRQYHLDRQFLEKYSQVARPAEETLNRSTSYDIEFTELPDPITDTLRKSKNKLFYRIFKRYPAVRQYDASDCGAACLAAILKYYGKKISPGYLRDIANVGRDGSNAASIIKAGKILGFEGKALRLDFENLKKMTLPVITHWQGYHWIVVFEIQKNHVFVADPAVGRRKLEKNVFTGGWTGIAIELLPTPRLKSLRSHKTSFQRFLPYLNKNRWLLFDIITASLIISIMGLATPVFTQTVIDRVLINQDTGFLTVILAGMLIISLFSLVMNIIRQYLVINLGNRIEAEMMQNFVSYIFRLPLKYFESRKTGDIMARYNENSKVRRFLTQTIINTMLDLVMVSIYLSFMVYFNSSLALVALPFIFSLLLTTYIFTPALKRNDQETFLKEADTDSFLIESLTAVRTIKFTAGEVLNRWKWENFFIKEINQDYRGSLLGLGFTTTGQLLYALNTALFLWYGSVLVMKNELTIGQFMAFNTLMISIMTPLTGLLATWEKFQDAIVSVDRLNDIFESRPEETGIGRETVLPPVKGLVKFDNVSFSYSNNDVYVLKNINLTVEPGEMVAIVGKSGCGKTTLMKLLLRLYPLTGGAVFIDGHDISEAALFSLRRQFGVVMQDNFLFSGTIRDNITYGNTGVSLEQLERVAHLSGIDTFVSQLPKGYDTVLTEKGKNISGGQRQRIAIARALINNPRILIFDEATSALDTESERVIQENIREIVKNRTSFIIAHRLSTIRAADRIIVMDKGEIAEVGTHSSLMEKKGLYYYLNCQQLETD